MAIMNRRRMIRTAFAVPCAAYYWGGGLLGPPRLYAEEFWRQNGLSELLPRTEGIEPFLAENMVKARLVQYELAGIDARITRIQGRFVVLVEKISTLKTNQTEIDRRIDFLCENEERLEVVLQSSE